MARVDVQGKRIIPGCRLHLYNDTEDYGIGTVIKGPGGVHMISMEIESKLSGKYKLKEIEKMGISFVIVERPVESQVFTPADLYNLNYLISQGFTGSIRRNTSHYQITITITEL